MTHFNEVVEEEKARFIGTWLPNGKESEQPQMEADFDQAMHKAVLAVLQEVHDEIPEAYGWGPQDNEADRGYRICSKNVKAEINRRITTLRKQLTDKE